MRSPLGRVQPSVTSPTGSGSAATGAEPVGHASSRVGEAEPVDDGGRLTAGLGARRRRRRWPSRISARRSTSRSAAASRAASFASVEAVASTRLAALARAPSSAMGSSGTPEV